jgi:hypothetical protein
VIKPDTTENLDQVLPTRSIFHKDRQNKPALIFGKIRLLGVVGDFGTNDGTNPYLIAGLDKIQNAAKGGRISQSKGWLSQ